MRPLKNDLSHRSSFTSSCGQTQSRIMIVLMTARAQLTNSSRRQKRLLQALLLARLGLCRVPDGQAEGNLVHEIRQVVNQVERGVVDTVHQVSEEVTQWVDGPSHSDDEAHGAESRCD